MPDQKTISPNKITGQLGVNLIERVVLGEMGYIWNSQNAELDVGIDGAIEIVTPDNGPTGSILQVQSKTLADFTADTDASFQYLCNQRDIDYWMKFNAPVLLVVSRSRSQDEAYWKEVKSHFADPKVRAQRRVVFDKKADRFDGSAAAALRELAVPRSAGLHLPPPPKPETLLSNLLAVESLPKHIYVADAGIGKYETVWKRARDLDEQLPGAWMLKSGQVWSVHDLREAPWDRVLGRCGVEAFDAEEVAWSDDPDEARDFAHLLRRCLIEMTWDHGVKYRRRKGDNLFYFMSGRGNVARTGRWRSTGNPFTLFGPQLKKDKSGGVSYYMHHAFAGRFRRLGEAWYLEIEPTYYYTRDGREESLFAADLLAGKKRLDRNPAVLGGVQLWAATLTGQLVEASEPKPGHSPLFDGHAKHIDAGRHPPGPYPHLAFGELLAVECPVGLNDPDWLKREEKDDATDSDEQGSLFDSWDEGQDEGVVQ